MCRHRYGHADRHIYRSSRRSRSPLLSRVLLLPAPPLPARLLRRKWTCRPAAAWSRTLKTAMLAAPTASFRSCTRVRRTQLAQQRTTQSHGATQPARHAHSLAGLSPATCSLASALRSALSSMHNLCVAALAFSHCPSFWPFSIAVDHGRFVLCFVLPHLPCDRFCRANGASARKLRVSMRMASPAPPLKRL